jgi:lambda family phage tail tape measure protein
MADLRYTVDIDTRGAQSALAGLRGTILGVAGTLAAGFGAKQIVEIAARFQDLRTTLGVLYKDTETGAKAFEQIKQFATESVFSVEDLTASVIKLKAAGLQPSIEQLKLFADVSSVSADSVGALQAITDLFARTTEGGLGLEDLNRLADRGIPVFKILGDELQLSRLEISKFGQTAEGAQVILAALTKGLKETFDGTSAARAGNLSQAFSNLGDALANTADVIGQAGLNQTITDAVTKFTELLDANQAVILGLTEGFVGAVLFLAENLKYLAGIMAGVFAGAIALKIGTIVVAVYNFAKALKAAAIAGTILQGVTGIGLAKVAAGLVASTAAIATISKLSGGAEEDIEAITQAVDDLKTSTEGPLSFPDAPDAPDLSDPQAALAKIKAEQDAITKSTINYFAEYKDGVDAIKRTADQEAILLKMTEEQANVQRELFAFQKRYYDTIAPLQRKVTELRLKDTDESKAQADEIERQIGLISELYNNTTAGLEEQLRLKEEIRRADEAAILLTDNRRNLEQDFRDLLRESKNELEDLSLTPFQRELKEINRTVDDTLIKSIRNIKQAWEDNLISGDEYIAEMKRLEAEAKKAEAILVEQARAAREIQRSFAYGWKEAFESYVDEATNAATTAEKIFEKTTKGMEDMIVNFAKTGKFEFKSFVADILEMLLRSQIQSIIAQTFSMPMGAGKASGGNLLGDLFAGFFANGGMIPAGQFGVAGEAGPELISGPATVTPIGNGGNVTYNIQAVDAASFKSMVARDPSFIHAVAQAGARKAPMGR